MRSLILTTHIAAGGIGATMMGFMFTIQKAPIDMDWLRFVSVFGTVIFSVLFLILRDKELIIKLGNVSVSEKDLREGFEEYDAAHAANIAQDGGCSCNDCHAGH